MGKLPHTMIWIDTIEAEHKKTIKADSETNYKLNSKRTILNKVNGFFRFR